jgi:hypothetical protein
MSDIDNIDLFSIYQVIDENRRVLQKFEAVRRQRDILLTELKDRIRNIPVYDCSASQAFEWRQFQKISDDRDRPI